MKHVKSMNFESSCFLFLLSILSTNDDDFIILWEQHPYAETSVLHKKILPIPPLLISKIILYFPPKILPVKLSCDMGIFIVFGIFGIIWRIFSISQIIHIKILSPRILISLGYIRMTSINPSYTMIYMRFFDTRTINGRIISYPSLY